MEMSHYGIKAPKETQLYDFRGRYKSLVSFTLPAVENFKSLYTKLYLAIQPILSTSKKRSIFFFFHPLSSHNKSQWPIPEN